MPLNWGLLAMSSIFETTKGGFFDGLYTPGKYSDMPLSNQPGLSPTDWSKIIRDLENMKTTSDRKSPDAQTQGANLAQKAITLVYKGIWLTLVLPKDTAEFFEDLQNVTKEELQVYSVTYPEHYARIRREWAESYNLEQATNIFDS